MNAKDYRLACIKLFRNWMLNEKGWKFDSLIASHFQLSDDYIKNIMDVDDDNFDQINFFILFNII